MVNSSDKNLPITVLSAVIILNFGILIGVALSLVPLTFSTALLVLVIAELALVVFAFNRARRVGVVGS